MPEAGAGDLEPAPAASVRGLDRDRQAVLGGEHGRCPGVYWPRRAWSQRRTNAQRDLARRSLVAERFDRRWRRADPGQPGGDDLTRELRVLGEEAISGVHGVRTGHGRYLEDLGDVQVAIGRRAAAQRERLVTSHDVQGVEI